MENKLIEKQVNRKPEIKLTLLENTVVSTPTQREYDELMQVYELGDLLWGYTKSLPTSLNEWTNYKDGTCVYYKDLKKGIYYFLGSPYNLKGSEVISTQKFYGTQKITQEDRKEANKYFERVKPDRKSKGGK